MGFLKKIPESLMNRKAISIIQLTIILVIIVSIVLAVQQMSFYGWDNVQKKITSLLGLQSKSAIQSLVRKKKCIHLLFLA